MKRWQSLILGIGISAVTLWLALRGTDLSQLGDVLKTAQYALIIPNLVLVAFCLVARAIRWRLLLNNNIEVKHSFHIINISYLLTVILPFRLGEVVRAWLTTRLTPPLSILTALSSVIVEKLLDLLSMVALVGLAITIAPITPEIANGARATGITAIAATLILIGIAARPTLAHRLLDQLLRIFPFLERFNVRHLTDRALDGIAPLASGRSLGLVLLWTAIGWALSVAQCYFLMYVIYPKASLDAALLMVTISSLAVALPAVPGSVGPFEIAITTALLLSGFVSPDKDPTLTQTRALAYAVILHIVATASYGFWGVVGLSQEQISLGEIVKAARQMATKARRTQETEPKSEDQNDVGTRSKMSREQS